MAKGTAKMNSCPVSWKLQNESGPLQGKPGMYKGNCWVMAKVICHSIAGIVPFLYTGLRGICETRSILQVVFEVNISMKSFNFKGLGDRTLRSSCSFALAQQPTSQTECRGCRQTELHARKAASRETIMNDFYNSFSNLSAEQVN